MLNYNNNDFPDRIEVWYEIARRLHIKKPNDDEVWQLAREHEEIPIMENIYMDLLLGRISDELSNVHNVEYYINCIDTRLTINGIDIDSIEEYNTALLKRLLDDLQNDTEDLARALYSTLDTDDFDTLIKELKELKNENN